jgi:hypothetical protein
VIEFVNLEIKLTQSFRDVHKSRMCVYVFIGVSTHMYIRIYIYIIFLTKKRITCMILLLSATGPNPGEFGSQKYSTPITCPDHNATNPRTVAADSSALSSSSCPARRPKYVTCRGPLVSTPNAPSSSSWPQQHSFLPARIFGSPHRLFLLLPDAGGRGGDDSLGPRLACSAHPASLPVPPPR